MPNYKAAVDAVTKAGKTVGRKLNKYYGKQAAKNTGISGRATVPKPGGTSDYKKLREVGDSMRKTVSTEATRLKRRDAAVAGGAAVGVAGVAGNRRKKK